MESSSNGADLDFMRTRIVEVLFEDYTSDRKFGEPADYHSQFPGYESVVDVEYRRLTAPDQVEGEVMSTLLGTVDEESFGRFRSLRRIGRGGQGMVFRAEDSLLGRSVALKVLYSVQSLEGSTRERFLREARLAAQLDHDHLCTVFDSGVEAGIPWISMQFVDGGDLSNRIEAWREERAAGPVSAVREAERVRWVVERCREIALALEHAHQHGVVHRDVKPGNILLREDGRCVLTDFGLARPDSAEMTVLTQTGDFLGTPSYLAPECQDAATPQTLSSGYAADVLRDVYAVGVTLYEGLSLVRPFEAQSRLESAQAVQSGIYRPLRSINPHVSKSLATVVATAMERDPRRRIVSAGALAEELQRIVEGLPIQSRSIGRLVRMQRWYMRNRAVAVIGSITILALAVSAVMSLYGLRQATVRSRDLAVSVTARLSLVEQPGLVRLDRGIDWMNEWLAKTEGILEMRSDLLARRDALIDAGSPAPDDGMAGRLSQDLRQTLEVFHNIQKEHGDSPYEDVAVQREFEVVRDKLDRARAAGRLDSVVLQEEIAQEQLNQLNALLETVKALASDREDVMTVSYVRSRRDLWLQAEAALRDEHAQRWADALQRLREAGPQFLSMRPVRDLVPLGPDPVSKLEEFALVGSGDIPFRETETTKVVCGATTAVVFVLVPGGTCKFGDIFEFEEGSQPPWGATLLPYWISKFETTMGQWERCLGKEAVERLPGDKAGALPVFGVSWTRATEFCERWGLELPTEAQWELASRGGQSGATFAWGYEVLGAEVYANLFDESASGISSSEEDLYGWNDGFPETAPVGTFDAGPFGLHDMQGNVCEWCRDCWVPVRHTVKSPGAGLTIRSSEGVNRVFRGASYAKATLPAHHTRRGTAPRTQGATLGFRASRRVNLE